MAVQIFFEENNPNGNSHLEKVYFEVPLQSIAYLTYVTKKTVNNECRVNITFVYYKQVHAKIE